MAEPPMTAASSSGRISTGVSATAPSGGDADFSARRRPHDRRGNAAGLAIVGADPKKWVELQSKIGVPVLIRI